MRIVIALGGNALLRRGERPDATVQLRHVAEQTAATLGDLHDWTMRRDGTGWRRAVPSPRPYRVIEIATADTLLRNGIAVVLARPR